MHASSSARRLLRRIVITVGTGGLLFQTTTGSGCDSTQVKTTIYTGLQQFATALVTAAFQSLESQNSTGTTTGTTTGSTSTTMGSGT